MSLGRLLLLSIFQVSWFPLYSVMQNSESEIIPFYKYGGESETLPPPSSSFQPPHVSLTPDTLAPFLFFLNKPSTCVPRARRALQIHLLKSSSKVLHHSWKNQPFDLLTHSPPCLCSWHFTRQIAHALSATLFCSPSHHRGPCSPHCQEQRHDFVLAKAC